MGQVGPGGETRRTEQPLRRAFQVTGRKTAVLSLPLVSSQEACVLIHGLQCQEGARQIVLVHRALPPAPRRAPDEKGRGRRQGGPSGAPSPQRCPLGSPSPTSQQTGEAFSKPGLRPPWQAPQRRLALAAPGRACKRSFCSRSSMGTSSGSRSRGTV